jgi:LuxR family maltose regulon positive regulatory protein
MALLSLAAGDPGGALGHLQGRERQRDPWVGGVVLHDLLLATALVRLGQEAEALTVIERAAVVATQNGVRYPLVVLPHGAFAELAAVATRLPPEATARRLFDGARFSVEMPDARARPMLTQREVVVLRELRSSRSAAQIAARLFVSSNTVKSQMRSLYRKLGVTSRVDAVAVALAQGLLDRQD